MGHIRKEELHESLINELEELGNIDLSGKQDKTDESLLTESKDLVGAINELFQDVDNGKNLIATSIGNPLITRNSTFSAMSEAILGLRRESENETDAKDVLYGMMIEDGYDSANSEMNVDELIDLLDRSGIEIGDIKQIACGYDFTFILKNDGSVWSCGLNDKGQLGLGDTSNRYTFTQVTTNINNDVKEIICGNAHTFILKNDGSIWGCGFNANGRLGLNDTTNRSTFTQVTTNIDNDVKQIACGAYYTFILKNDGSLWSCGRNDYGQLGLGDNTDRKTFTQVTTNINNDVKEVICGYYHTFILKNDGSVWSCGYNIHGQLGLNDYTDRTTFTQVTTNINNDVKQIVCGDSHNFILKNDGSVWSCGNNNNGQLGLGSYNSHITFTQVTTNINNDVKQIVCGQYHIFIIKNDGSVWSCGLNNKGQLGLGDNTSHSTFTQVTLNINNNVKQIACGGNHTFILKNDGSIWSCGLNDKGQLGLGAYDTDRNTFTNTNFIAPISEYEIDKIALYNYLLSNDIEVTESMDIGNMLNLLVDDYINNMILGYENNLRIILTDEGVSVTEEDDMASLITKVDTEFTEKNNDINSRVLPAGDAVATDVASGKTFINNTGEILTGTGKLFSTPITGTLSNTVASNFNNPILTIDYDFGFVPNVVVVLLNGFYIQTTDTISWSNCSGGKHAIVSTIHNSSTNALQLTVEHSTSAGRKHTCSFYISNITSTGFKVYMKSVSGLGSGTFSANFTAYYVY